MEQNPFDSLTTLDYLTPMFLANDSDQPLLTYTAFLDARGSIVAMNAEWLRMATEGGNPILENARVGISYLDICRQTLASCTDEPEETLEGLLRVLHGELPVFSQEYWYPSLAGERHFLLHITALAGAPGAVVTHIEITSIRRAERRCSEQIAQVAAFVEEVQAQKAQLEAINSKLEDMATLDGLTRLKNHRSFQEQLQQDIERAKRYQLPLSLALLDVDHFKRYNDAFGHPAGDLALVEMSKLLQSIARDTDFLARYGGEEFAIILPNTDSEGAQAMAQRFRAAIENAPWPRRPVTASFGTASLNGHICTPARLIEAADQALYAAKQAGRNCVRQYPDVALRDTKEYS